MKIVLNNKSKKELIDEYFIYQLKQFQNATNHIISMQKKSFWEEFNNYLQERYQTKEVYLSLLNDLKIDYNQKTCAELNKGIYDTATFEKNTTLITPYIYGLHKSKNNKIVKGTVKKDQNNKIIKNITTFITENPYQKQELEIWKYLLNTNLYNATIAVFGKNYDKDKLEKIEELKKLKEALKRVVKEEYITVDDNYFYILKNDRNKENNSSIRNYHKKTYLKENFHFK